MEAIWRAAPTAIGERLVSCDSSASVRTHPDTSYCRPIVNWRGVERTQASEAPFGSTRIDGADLRTTLESIAADPRIASQRCAVASKSGGEAAVSRPHAR